MQTTRRWLYSASAMFGLFISLLTFVSSPSPTHAATNAALPNFEASIIQCNGVTVPFISDDPNTWPLQGSKNGNLQTTKNNVNTTYSTFSLINSNVAPNIIYNNANVTPNCNSSRQATTQGPNTRIQVSWDLSRYFAQPLRAAINNGSISITKCTVAAYIPQGTNNAQQVRYDFWGTQTLSEDLNDGTYQLPLKTDFPWIAWPGGTTDQSTNTGWVTLGTNISLQNLGLNKNITARNLIVTLNDLDAQPGKAVWVTAMKFDCMYSASQTAFQTFTSSSPCQNGQLSQGWQRQDIGGSSLPGGDSCSGNSVVIKGTGTDIADITDQFHYVYYQPLNGDGAIVAHLANLQRGYETPYNQDKAGVMIRQSTAASAPNVAMLFSENRTAAYFQSRATDGNQTTQTQNPFVSQSFTPWLMLVRKGNTFTGYLSNSGGNNTWTSVGSVSMIQMTGPVLIGLAVTPNDSDHRVADIATFDNITVTPMSS